MGQLLRHLKNRLHDAFFGYFDLEVVRTAAQRDQVAGLRHRVYSEECRFEPRAPSRRERDIYDGHSLHCLITHRSSGLPAGCIRLILATGEHRLALEEHCLDSMYLSYAGRLSQDRERACEVSRLAVHPVFRRHNSQGYRRSAERLELDCCDRERRTFSMVSTAAMLAAVAMAEISHRPYLYAMTNNMMPRLLRRSGVEVERAGDFVDYHGPRAAHFVSTERATADLRPGLRPVYRAIKMKLTEDAHRASFAVAQPWGQASPVSRQNRVPQTSLQAVS